MSLELAHVLIVTCFFVLGSAALAWVALLVNALWAKWEDHRNPVQPPEVEQSAYVRRKDAA